jgi:hypothetical protein
MPQGPVTPGAIGEQLADYVELLTEVAETRVDPLKLGKVYENLSTHYRALGICHLSGEANTDEFFHYLIQSALTRRHYLRVAEATGGGELGHRRASFLDPALDAIAARQWRLAADLFRLVAPDWTAGEEYEDDFCYADVIRRIVTEAGAGVEAVLERWEEVLEGGSDLRLDVAKALHSRASAAFSDALRALLAAEEEKARVMADPDEGSLPDDQITFFPNRWISVEGLALLVLAEREDIGVSDLFPACPPLARAGVFTQFESKGYPYERYLKEDDGS